jgi:putative membrane protein
LPESWGHLSSHMLQHIVLMNLAVPILVFFVLPNFRSTARLTPAGLWRSWPAATAVQIILLWGWHSPGVLPGAMSSSLLMALMHLSLVASAAWFWLSIATMPRDASWRAIFALLITGKLFCLLGALLVFAPDTVYDFTGMHHAMHGSALADQHLAGLMMLIACPASYVLAGVALASRWFLGIEAETERHA